MSDLQELADEAAHAFYYGTHHEVHNAHKAPRREREAFLAAMRKAVTGYDIAMLALEQANRYNRERTQKIIRLERELAEVGKETERLDWLLSQGSDLCIGVSALGGPEIALHSGPRGRGKTYREAIDNCAEAARAKEAGDV